MRAAKVGRMKLRDYVLGMPPEDRERFAARAGTTTSYLPLLMGGHRKPSHELARRMVEASDGALALSDLRPDIWPPHEAA